MKLQKVSQTQPKGLLDFLLDFSKGDNGVKGPNITDPNFNIENYLNSIIAMENSKNLQPGYVAMNTYWLLDSQDCVVGISKLRHWLTKTLFNRGGHIGYYIKESERNKGIGTLLLKETLKRAKELGLQKVLITTDVNNFSSIGIILKNGGKLEDTRVDNETGIEYNRYWIVLD